MAYGADSLGVYTYRLYSRQQKSSAWTRSGHPPIDCTADDLPERLEAFLNQNTERTWVRWWLLICDSAAREYRAVCNEGIWKVNQI